MFEKILVCLDGSELAEQIIPYATEQALGFRSELILIQVVQEPLTYGPGIPGTEPTPIKTDGMVEEARKALAKAKDYLDRLAASLRKKGIQVSAVATLGGPGETIVGYAERNNVSLITIATHGRSGLGRAVFGSVADYVLRNSGLPVLLIRSKRTA